MRRSAVDVWGRALTIAGVGTILVVFTPVATSPSHAWPPPQAWHVTALIALTAPFLLFMVLARGLPRLPPPRRDSLRHVVPKATFLVATSASEEIVWRWLVLGGLAPYLGPLPALAASTLGFAASHARWQGRRGFVVHLLTGTTFGAVFLVTGSIVAAATAHASYNVLVALAVESARTSSHAPAAANAAARARADDRTADPAPAAIPARLTGVEKRFGQVTALRALDLELRPGEIVALVGPNGAGKTTALAILLGLRRPDAGTASLFGADPRRPRARENVGAAPQESGFPPTLTVREIVDLVRAHYPTPAATGGLLERFALTQIARRQAGGLSGGERQRLAVALAFAGNPEAIFLDERTSGLDVGWRRAFRHAIEDFAAGGGAVLLTTHDLAEVEALATRVVVLSGGRVAGEGTVAEIRAWGGLRRVRLPPQRLPALPGVVQSAHEDGRCVLYVEDAGEVVRRLAVAGASLDGLEVLPVDLEEAFLVLTDGRA